MYRWMHFDLLTNPIYRAISVGNHIKACLFCHSSDAVVFNEASENLFVVIRTAHCGKT